MDDLETIENLKDKAMYFEDGCMVIKEDPKKGEEDGPERKSTETI